MTPERKIQITFIDDEGNALPLENPTVSAISGDRSSPTRMTFEKRGGSLVSDKPLPEGDAVPIILQIRTTPGANNITEKFNVDLENCPTCEHREYACVCEH